MYTRFRVDGLKIRYSARLVGVVGAGTAGVHQADIDRLLNAKWLIQHRVGGPDDNTTSSLLPNPYLNGETRWDKNSLITVPNTPFKIHTCYFNVRRILGNNQYVRGSAEYIGLTDPAEPSAFSQVGLPAIGPNLRIGVCSWSTTPWWNNANLTMIIEYRAVYTWYITYFDRVQVDTI